MAFAITRGLGDDSLPALPIDQASNDPLLQQLHSYALEILAEKQTINALLNAVSNADSDPDVTDQLAAETELLAQTVAQFNAVAAQRNGVAPYALDTFDQTVLAVGNVIGGIPTSIATLANTVTDTLAAALSHLEDQIAALLRNAGSGLLGASLPFFALGALALVFVLQAEKSRTYRKVAT